MIEKIKLSPDLANGGENNSTKDQILTHFAEGEFHLVIEGIISVKDQINIPLEVINSPEVQREARYKIAKSIAYSDTDVPFLLRDRLNLSSEIFKRAIEEGMTRFLVQSPSSTEYNNDIENFKKIISRYQIFPEVIGSEGVQGAARDRVVDLLYKYHLSNTPELIKIIEIFNLPQDFINSPIVEDAAKSKIDYCLMNNNTETADQLKKYFNIA